MSDTHREKAIIQAIEILTNKRISQANFDKTVKGTIKAVKDKPAGEYLIKYQDSEFTAYATNSQANYEEGEQVYILIAGNDWAKSKTIIGGVNNKATTFVDIPKANSLYNRLGTNLITLSQKGELSSYKENGDIIVLYGGKEDTITIDDKVINRYIKTGNALAVGIKVRTELSSSQIGGDYGLVLNLKFKNDNDPLGISEEQEWENAVVRSYVVGSKDVIGNPYFLTSQTLVETLIEDINIEKFLGVDNIYIYCDGFPQVKQTEEQKENQEIPEAWNIKDIIISQVYIYGAEALNEQNLNGYVVHLDYSETGNILDEDNINLKVTAQLKAKGQLVTQNAEYYWFRQNGLIYRGDPKYNGRAGDGWQCLNAYAGSMAIPQQTGDFFFSASGQDAPQSSVAACFQKVNKVRCVIVYQNRAFTGETILYNHNGRQVTIVSSDLIEGQNKTVYYLNSGSPTLTCNVYGQDLDKYELDYTWRVTPPNGKGEFVPATEEDYQSYRDQYLGTDIIKGQKQLYDEVSPDSKEIYAELDQYKEALANYNKYLNDSRVEGNQYINFPISSIRGSSKITCAVKDNNTGIYLGTGSITLYNKINLQGSYSLSIDNGTQVFQYDEKGNSPTSNHLEKPLNIQPLTFTLLDNTGKEISFAQIVNNGYVKWLLPNKGTLLGTTADAKYSENNDYLLAIGEDKQFLNQGYNIYQNLQSFPYFIAQRYDKDCINNDIRLHIKYKDLIFDVYTEFTFPKDGDPGTNGTDFVGKISSNNNAERIHGTSEGVFFDSFGNVQDVDTLSYTLYNNSLPFTIDEKKVIWQIPPKQEDKVQKYTSHFKINNNGQLSLNTTSSVATLPFVDIVRAKYTDGQLKYYAEYPICYEEVKENYRIRVKPKTGYEYVVYAEDGTRPDYDNREPFEVIVEYCYQIGQSEVGYWAGGLINLIYQWSFIGNFNRETAIIKENTCEIAPADKFDGADLSSSIVCTVKQDEQKIGIIYIPVYMILNRYGHQALNDWDGNSIELNGAGNTILAPQIGAGVKDDINGFTGVFMGAIQGLENGQHDDNVKRNVNDDNYKIGFAGYHQGARTIFLDSKTGKAEFGKNNAGRIILDPSQKINDKDAALIYSENYPIADFIEEQDVELVGQKYKDDREDKGMIIDLSTPQIGFGSGNFTVNDKGHLIAKGGGQIAGWSITDTKLHKNNKVGMASSDEAVPSDIDLKNGENDTVAFWAGGSLENGRLKSANFYATHGGYLFAKLGQIAKWNFDNTRFYSNNNKVGMSSVNDDSSKYKITLTNKDNDFISGFQKHHKAFFAGQNNEYYVTHEGYLRCISGKIASWSFNDKDLTNGEVGLGSGKATYDINYQKNNPKKVSNPRFWSNNNFAVDASGNLYSAAGYIGGWKINETSLVGTDSNKNSITINSDGSIYSGTKKAKSGNWGISADGSVYFNNGTIGTVKIDDNGISGSNNAWYIRNGSARIPGLKVSQKDGAVYYNITSNGSGISNGSESHVLGGNDFISKPDNTFTNKDKTENYTQYIKKLAVGEILFGKSTGKRSELNQLTIYSTTTGSLKKGTLQAAGDVLFSVTKTGATSSVNFSVKPGCSVSFGGHEGQSGTLIFSNKAWLKFSCGILYRHHIPKTVQMSWN